MSKISINAVNAQKKVRYCNSAVNFKRVCILENIPEKMMQMHRNPSFRSIDNVGLHAATRS